MNLRKILIIISVFFMLLGCNDGNDSKPTKYFEFTEPEKMINSDRVHTRMVGNWYKSEGEPSVYKGPYMAVINISFSGGEELLSHTVTFSDISLTPVGSNQAVYTLDSVVEKVELSEWNNTYIAAFASKKLPLDYVDHEMKFSYILNDGKHTKTTEVMQLKRDYHERKITFWDVLMGI